MEGFLEALFLEFNLFTATSVIKQVNRLSFLLLNNLPKQQY